MIKRDCFALINGKCDCLNKTYCEYEKCSFYKPKAKEAPAQGNIDEILQVGGILLSTERTKKYCEFFLGEPGHFCKATTQESCKNCHFYSPKMPTKAQLLADMVAQEKRQKERLINALAEETAKQDCIFDQY